MSKYIYLTSNPEALVASMLTPEAFGHYLSTGTKKRSRGQAIYFEVDLAKIEKLIDMDSLNRRCVPKPDGSPKSSVYLSVYKVLEMVPPGALKSLYLSTEHGSVLELKKGAYDTKKERNDELHLYQELCPVSPMVASSLPPSVFVRKLTDGSTPIVLPRLFFVELKLDELATNPLNGSAEELPYNNVEHLRDCLEIIKTEEGKQMKTVNRMFSGEILYRTIDSGFYVGTKSDTIYYPYPEMEELEKEHYHFFKDL